jgi:hypothetical protein
MLSLTGVALFAVNASIILGYLFVNGGRADGTSSRAAPVEQDRQRRERLLGANTAVGRCIGIPIGFWAGMRPDSDLHFRLSSLYHGLAEQRAVVVIGIALPTRF